MQGDRHGNSTTGMFGGPSDSINPYEASQVDASAGGKPCPPRSGPFAAPGWEYVRDGLVLVFVGYLAALAAYVLLLLLVRSGAVGALVGAGLVLLAALAVLVGKWMCRGVPADTGLRDAITFACLAFSCQWLIGAATGILNHWLHLGQTALVLARFSSTLAEWIGMGCFLWFLRGVARASADERLFNKAKTLFGSFVLFYSVVLLSRLISFNSTGHLAHHSHLVHHLRGIGPLVGFCLSLPILGALIAWLVSYLSLLKSLADKIDENRQ